MSNARDKANIPVLNFQSKGIDDNADATAITIDSSERVGLNTTTPGAKLEINSTGSYYNTANQHQQWSYNGTPFLSLYMDAYASPYFDTDSASSWNPGATMVFKRQGSEKMRITNTGSVGIGTSSPAGKLHIVQTAETIDDGIKIVGSSSPISGRIYMNSDDVHIDNATAGAGTGITLDTSGNLGIGTSSPSNILEIAGNGTPININSTNDEVKKIQFENSGSVVGYIGSSSGTPFRVLNGSASEFLRIDSSGNVGIGTSSPVTTLTVGSNNSGGQGVVGKQALFSGTNTLTYNSGNSATWGGITIVNQDNTSNRTGTGITFVNRSSSSGLAGIQSTNNGTAERADLRFITRGSGGTIAERVRIDDDGNVGIGTTTPHTKLEVYNTSNGGVITAHRNSEASGDYTGYEFHTNSSSTQFKKGAIYFKANGSGYGRGDIVFCNDGVANSGNVGLADEKLRITSNGQFLYGKTSAGTAVNGIEFESNGKFVVSRSGTSGGTPMFINRNDNDGAIIIFKRDDVEKGTISITGSSTNYNTSSDYRLKENVSYDFDATTRLKQLKPARFNFIADANTTVDGFLAHEVSDIVPEAISGTKDAVQVWEEGDELPEGVSVGDNKLDENGNTIPDYQGIDQAKLVPLLVKTIQELEARITTLEANNP